MERDTKKHKEDEDVPLLPVDIWIMIALCSELKDIGALRCTERRLRDGLWDIHARLIRHEFGNTNEYAASKNNANAVLACRAAVRHAIFDVEPRQFYSRGLPPVQNICNILMESQTIDNCPMYVVRGFRITFYNVRNDDAEWMQADPWLFMGSPLMRYPTRTRFWGQFKCHDIIVDDQASAVALLTEFYYATLQRGHAVLRIFQHCQDVANNVFRDVPSQKT